jgi:hypothetical protein
MMTANHTIVLNLTAAAVGLSAREGLDARENQIAQLLAPSAQTVTVRVKTAQTPAPTTAQILAPSAQTVIAQNVQIASAPSATLRLLSATIPQGMLIIIRP